VTTDAFSHSFIVVIGHPYSGCEGLKKKFPKKEMTLSPSLSV